MGLMLLGGILFDLIALFKKNNHILYIPVFAFFGGMVWEALSFCVGFIWDKAWIVIIEWIAYGGVTIICLGLPVLLLIKHIRKEKKIWGFKTIGFNGLAFTFAICFALTIILLYSLVNHTGIFEWAAEFTQTYAGVIA